MPVEVVHFNPLRRRPGIVGRILPRRSLNNFGDLIGPLIVSRLVSELQLAERAENTRLVAVGSIMKMTRPGDVVWGAGVNGKSLSVGASPDIDVRAVRGPLSRELLVQSGASVPEVFGDPALLWSRFWPRRAYVSDSGRDQQFAVSVVPNFHDRATMSGPHVVDPLQEPHRVAALIARSSFVCGSSLHGIVLAESFGIPARLVTPGTEPDFKYQDYYAGTGRTSYEAALSVGDAIAMGGEPPPLFDADALLRAFPRDLWASKS